MIKQTFYNLPERKRERIIKAIREEFSSQTNEKISINSIIKKAEISRGSFYQYFDDKTDLVGIIVDEISSKLVEIIQTSLKENDGNIFEMALKMFDYMVRFAVDENKVANLKNLFENIKASGKTLSCGKNCNSNSQKYVSIIENMKTDYLKFEDEQSVIHLLDILMMISKSAIFDVVVGSCGAYESRQNLIAKINLIKCGTLRENVNV